jgi:hypothetical protein
LLSLVGLVHILNMHIHALGQWYTSHDYNQLKARAQLHAQPNSLDTAATIAKAVDKAVDKSCCRPADTHPAEALYSSPALYRAQNTEQPLALHLYSSTSS